MADDISSSSPKPYQARPGASRAFAPDSELPNNPPVSDLVIEQFDESGTRLGRSPPFLPPACLPPLPLPSRAARAESTWRTNSHLN